MKLSPETIDILISKKLSNELTEQEHAQFNAWYLASTENKDFFKEQAVIWESFSKKNTGSEEIDFEFSRLEQRLNMKAKSNVLYIWRSAAAIAALLVVGFSYVMFFSSTESYFQAESAGLEFVLNDQSRIHLNRYSSLKYSETDAQRRIQLDGEAFFEVAHDGRPFIVETRSSKVEVLGTKFTVHEENGVTTVAVREGKVRLTQLAEATSLLLTKGMFAVSANMVAETDSTQFYDLTAWLSNRIVFREQTFGTIVEKLENRFHLRIEVKSERLKSIPISASLLTNDTNELLHALANLVNANLEKSERGFVFSEK